MFFVRVNSRISAKLPVSVVRLKKRQYSAAVLTTEEKSTTPRYPPIVDQSVEARNRRKRESFAKAIENARTIEEKMIMINMPRYYGWKSTLLNESKISYNSIDQTQYITRTHVIKEPGLPSYYNDIVRPEKMKKTVETLRGSIEDSLIFEHSSRKRLEELDKSVLEDPSMVDDIVGCSVSKQVHRFLMSHLAADNPHLLETEIDDDPRIEAFWFAGGIMIPPGVKIWRKRNLLPESLVNAPVDRAFQYLGSPNFQLRHRLPLPEIIPQSESNNSDFTIPVFKYDPKVLGHSLERRHGMNIPGFWPGDESEFGLVSYHKCGHLVNRRFGDESDALKVQAVLGSWGWLLAQANNLGFSTFNDVTYPLMNQMIITNGKWWTFCVYQLNTTIVHSHHNDENPRRNICWMTEPMRLFEKIENDKVYGLNDEVLEHLVKFYTNEPREREGIDMKPYLKNGEGLVANIRGPKKRAWLEERFKLLASNRPRHRPLPEVYNWQNIYQRKHKTRPIDKKRYPWEFHINIWHRKLNDHHPRYIPRAVRGGKIGSKWETMFYPK